MFKNEIGKLFCAKKIVYVNSCNGQTFSNNIHVQNIEKDDIVMLIKCETLGSHFDEVHFLCGRNHVTVDCSSSAFLDQYFVMI